MCDKNKVSNMFPPRKPRNPGKRTQLDAWRCDDCDSTFAVIGDFGDPTFCPNCSSQNISEAQYPDDPRRPDRPDWPYPEFLM